MRQVDFIFFVEKMLIKNTSNDRLFISGFKAFDPGEERNVTKEEAKTLLANPNFEESRKMVDTDDEPKKSKKK